MHSLSGLFEYVGALAGLALLLPTFRSSPSWRALAPVTALASVFAAIGFLGMLSPALAHVRGLSQRIAELAIFLWIARASLFLGRAGAQTQ